MDPRTKDAIRATPPLLEKLVAEIQQLKADQKASDDYMKEQLRAIKKSVVRKYGAGEGETQNE